MALPRIAPYTLPAAHEVPPARGPWRLEANRAALLVHDMQNYFVGAFTPGTSPIEPVITNIARLAQGCRKRGIPVIYSCQNGDQDRRDRGLQADLWGPGMSSRPEHRDVVAPLAPQAGDLIVTKHRYSAFQRNEFESMLRARGRDQLIVCGVFAHIGCLLTVADAFQRDIEAFLVADAVADFSREMHDLSLRYIADCVGVAVTTEGLEGSIYD